MSEKTKITPGPLQEQLNAKADAQLRSEICELFAPIQKMCSSARFDPGEFKNTLPGFQPTNVGGLWLDKLVIGLRNLVEGALTDQNRARYTSDFIAKVESLRSQVEELTGQIQQ